MVRILFSVASLTISIGLFPSALSATVLPAQEAKRAAATNTDPDQQRKFDDVVVAAFSQTHEGWSSDEVILNDRLNDAFIRACQHALPNADPAKLNWRLLNLRKAGKLSARSTKSNRSSVNDVVHIAEMAARTIVDRQSISTDRMMTDPNLRAEFDSIARSIAPDVDLYRVRKAAFQLRKTRRLRPELIARIADWGRVITTHSTQQILDHPELIAPHPGIYIFRDQTGYLYIGQSDNLRERMKSHLDQSHNPSLARYLGTKDLKGITVEVHAFAPDSRARETMIRRAYESELIASRKPRFNIQP